LLGQRVVQNVVLAGQRVEQDNLQAHGVSVTTANVCASPVLAEHWSLVWLRGNNSIRITPQTFEEMRLTIYDDSVTLLLVCPMEYEVSGKAA
jgi:hypothetical protein